MGKVHIDMALSAAITDPSHLSGANPNTPDHSIGS